MNNKYQINYTFTILLEISAKGDVTNPIIHSNVIKNRTSISEDQENFNARVRFNPDQTHQPSTHPKNKVLTRKNTPATLPTLNRINGKFSI